MITMIDEIFDRHYQAGRTQMNASFTSALSRLGEAIGTAFAVLQRIEYSEPWNVKRKPTRARAR
jgi:hypothetical protein